METKDLPTIHILHKPRINLPVEAIRETVSLLPIEAGDVLFRMTNEPTYSRHLITNKDERSSTENKRENLPAFSQLEMYDYVRRSTADEERGFGGEKLFPDKSDGFVAFSTVATANSTGDGALADALRVFYGPDGKHKVFVSKTLKPNGKTAYDSDSGGPSSPQNTTEDPLVIEDLA
jgi:hypothetical protein